MGDWPRALHAVIEAIMRYFASKPALAPAIGAARAAEVVSEQRSQERARGSTRARRGSR
ncbi:MAG TPA: hypothetical protein VIJ66_05260 [Solirubrobacteraceae bacterium]